MTITTIFTVLGYVSTFSFLFIALGDSLVTVINILAAHLRSTWLKKYDVTIDFWWGNIKEIYQDYREILNAFSIFSRPDPELRRTKCLRVAP